MGAPYSSQSVSNYNSNPPPDDGSQTEANRIKWATIKTKLSDPLNTFASAVNTAIGTAFGKIIGGAGVTSTSTSYQVLSTDQGKLVRASSSGITITTPDATDVGSPFVFGVLNDSTGDITLDGSGSQTIDGSSSVTLPANTGLLLFTDGSNWLSTGQNFQRTQIVPQGYLTVIPEATDALNPFPSSDQSAKTAVYYRPDVGNLIPISDGTNFQVRIFSQLTLTLVANHLADTIYDVFVFDDSGTMRIATGPAWNTITHGSGARGTGAGTTELSRLKGLIVNTNQLTVRNGSSTYTMNALCGTYVGTILIDGSAGQVTCHTSYGQSRKWGIWNPYNQREIKLKAGTSTASWTYSTQTWRAANGESANSIAYVTGLADRIATARYIQNVGASGTSSIQRTNSFAIGWNSTTSPSGKRGIGRLGEAGGTATIRADFDLVAEYFPVAAIGAQTVSALEINTDGVGSLTMAGQETGMLLTVAFWG